MEKKTDYAFEYSEYQAHRQQFIPACPDSLSDAENNKVSLTRSSYPVVEGLKELFPTLLGSEMPYLELKFDQENGQLLSSQTPLNVAVVLSGGQAAGGHNVIMGVFDMIKKIHPDSKLYGFLMGPHGVYSNRYIEINKEYMQLYRNMGGFDMICSGRHKIESAEQFEASLRNCDDLNLDGLVVIGGDDSNTNACLLAEYFLKHNAKTKVIGCPKTIDGDLKNEHIEVSFGFDTATRTYSEAIGNLCVDAMSGKGYYYFVRLMGRSASHIALECALQTRVNWVLIGEEVEQQKQTLSQITKHLADLICKRSELKKNYGVILVPEGLIEFIPEVKKLITQINEILSKEFQDDIREYVANNLEEDSRILFNFLPKAISDQLLLDRDPHGNVQVSKIDTERLLILLLRDELDSRQSEGKYNGHFAPQAHFFGYEGRCAIPSNFDAQYCYGLGLNAAVLIREGATGYMSCVKNLSDRNPKNWIAAGCPLPTMMHLERRKGKDVPVIKKALVDLNGPNYLSYVAIRDKWAYLDCYRSPGPIQFNGPSSDSVCFLVKPPVLNDIVAETDEHEVFENSNTKASHFHRHETNLSELSKARIQDVAAIPNILTSNNYLLTAVKRYKPFSQLVKAKIDEQFPLLKSHVEGTYFVEVQDKTSLLQDFENMKHDDQVLYKLNQELYNGPKPERVRIGVIYLGRHSPGGNNVVDGLIRYQKQRGNVDLIGFVHGLNGLMEENTCEITEETFKPFKNLGGYDYLGRSHDLLRTQVQQSQAAKVCTKLNLNGLVIIGATHSLSDASTLSEYFLANNVSTRVIAVPSTVDGNIRHQYISTSIGFDTASKVYSQLIGNMLTDSASAIKYWYFIRLMGRDPSHLALECAIQTHPNMVIISEECASRGETLIDIVNRICDVICERAKDDKNYGCVLIPEGLLNHVAAYKHMIEEINKVFSEKNRKEAKELSQKFYENEKYVKDHLTPWSYSLYTTLPDFLKKQLLFEREVEGLTKISQIETEKLISYFVDLELQSRKAKKQYKGGFAPVTHYFGYQGRCSHPTLFDCSLASTYGFTAGILIENNMTGLCVTAQQITSPATHWRVGGVPLLSMVRSQPKSGFSRVDLVVPSEEVDLNGEAYQRMKAIERGWRWVDHYSNPGPIQFYDQGSDRTDFTLDSIFHHRTKITDQIKALCHSIQNDCLFVEHQHLLIAALSSLESAKSVINSMTQNASLGAQNYV